MRSPSHLCFAGLLKRSMQTAYTDSDSLPHTMADLRNFDMSAVSVMDLLPPRAGGGPAGAKFAPALYKGNELKLLLGTPTQPDRVPYEIGNFDRNVTATRVNITFEVEDPIVQAFFVALDKALIEILTQRSTDFFKKALTKDQVALCFTPTLNVSPPYKATIKGKSI